MSERAPEGADPAVALPRVRPAHPLGGLLVGAWAHTAKYVFILVHAYTGGVAKNFVVFGFLESLGLHLAFGAVGGLLGGLLAAAWLRPGWRKKNPQWW